LSESPRRNHRPARSTPTSFPKLFDGDPADFVENITYILFHLTSSAAFLILPTALVAEDPLIPKPGGNLRRRKAR